MNAIGSSIKSLILLVFAGVGVPGLYQGGQVPGQGFGGRGVLPGVATGNGLNPKSLPGGGQQGPGGSGRVGYGGPMQPGVFHGYPLKTPKTQGGYGAKAGGAGGKLPFGYGGFGGGGGAGLPGGPGSKPGYPIGTGVGTGGLNPAQAQAKAAKYGAGLGGVPGAGGAYPGVGGAYPGGYNPAAAKAAKYGKPNGVGIGGEGVPAPAATPSPGVGVGAGVGGTAVERTDLPVGTGIPIAGKPGATGLPGVGAGVLQPSGVGVGAGGKAPKPPGAGKHSETLLIPYYCSSVTALVVYNFKMIPSTQIHNPSNNVIEHFYMPI
uniref:Elastin n=1 Tax=Hucho hucho TaxID=62062 RepID=A0A4W5PSX0_9TELE